MVERLDFSTAVLARGIVEDCHSDAGYHLDATAVAPVGVDRPRGHRRRAALRRSRGPARRPPGTDDREPLRTLGDRQWSPLAAPTEPGRGSGGIVLDRSV